MEALYLLIPISVATVFVALWVFFKASDHGQFDDLVGPALRVLQDDDKAQQPAGMAADAEAKLHGHQQPEKQAQQQQQL